MYSVEIELSVVAALSEEKIIARLTNFNWNEILYLKSIRYLNENIYELLGGGPDLDGKLLAKRLGEQSASGAALRDILFESRVDEVKKLLADPVSIKNLSYFGGFTGQWLINESLPVVWRPGLLIGDFYDPQAAKLLEDIVEGKLDRNKLLEVLHGYYGEAIREAAVRSPLLLKRDLVPFLEDQSLFVAGSAKWNLFIGQKKIWLENNLDFINSLSEADLEFFIGLYSEEEVELADVLRLLQIVRNDTKKR
jgi:hypothetical protein